MFGGQAELFIRIYARTPASYYVAPMILMPRLQGGVPEELAKQYGELERP